MPETFEERIGKELDTLYQGALFLTAGNEAEAERLLIETAAGAFHLRAEGARDARWFEGRLAGDFLGSTLAPGPEPHRLAEIVPVPALEADDLFEAAASVPSWARAALWLVLLRQWTYGEASEALGVPLETLRRMLEYRHVLVREILRSDRRPDGANGSVT